MGDTHDPMDHFRTTDQHCGQSMIDVYCWPGLWLIAVGAGALVSCFAVAAYNHHEWIATLGVIAVVSTIAGILLVAVENRRVRCLEKRWLVEHPSIVGSSRHDAITRGDYAR
ncbi:hypothetical protein AN480_28535 (plasmid) [Mycobacterium intracellulare subsp. chimaera]|nr:hypothetical protein AN480_28535 [Mycobacterium intracellulare subsp. chimaera]